ncbi:MAG: RNA-directed DNA polymerase [Saprospiraceae bacterium]|nr:RNA-directed DNA polymerase [Saprospiraceae bacterium]
MAERLTRQQLYDRIRETSKEEYILSEMKRLGFWNPEGELPKLSEKLIEEKGGLRKELNQLMDKQRQFRDKERMLKEMRQKRMKEALARRAETKERQERLRQEKAEKWAEKKSKEIVYLGKGVSAGLSDKVYNEEKLKQNGLPIFKEAIDLANAMEIDLGELRFLAYHRTTARTSHYKRFYIPKKSGGKRLISAPMPRLKKAQYWILHNILYKMDIHEAAHGFVPKRSIISNAQGHLGSAVVINVDMKDFFPSVTFRRVKGLFKGLGYSQQIATVLALLCTEANTDEIELDGELFFVSKGERFLPQGAPTSPALTNILCRKLDKRFKGMVDKLGWKYTRYADDLTFSSHSTKDVSRVLWQTKKLIEDEGFVLHPDKVHVMRKGSRQEVTGIVVNEKLSVSRKKLKQFRTVLHKIEQTGTTKGLCWGNGHLLQTIKGYANYVNMVNPTKGAVLLERVQGILAKPELQAELAKYVKEKAAEKQQKVSVVEEKTVQAESTTDGLDAEVRQQTKENTWWDIFA